MQTLIQNMTKLFHPKNRKWGVGLTILIAVAIVGGVVYYGGYFKDLFKRAKAAEVKTWIFDNPDDYTASSGITFGSNRVSVDLNFSSITLPPLSPNITDLWYNGSNILGAAINYDNYVAYSIDDGAWDLLPINFGGTGGAQQGIRIKRITDGGAFNYVFGLGTTAESGTNPGNAAVVYGTMSPSSLGALRYVSLPFANSFTAGISYKGRLYGGLSPKTNSDPNLVSISQDLSDPVFSTIGVPGQIPSINNFLIVGGKLYATVTDTAFTSGNPRIWVTDNGIDWVEASMDPTDPGTTHTSTHSIVTDSEGYVYVATSATIGKSDYILKSTTAGGNVFKKIALPAGSSANGLIYADDANNLWIPLTDGGVLRAIDYQGGIGASSFFRTNSEINFTGGNTLKIEDAVKISNGKIIWAGGVWNNSTFVSGVGRSSRTANDQTIVNNTGIKFFDLQSFSTIVPPIASNAEFKYRISNFSPGGPWYYYNPAQAQWVWSALPDFTQANTDDDINNYIGQFKGDVGFDTDHDLFYFQAVYHQPAEDLGNYDIILNSLSLTYVRQETTLTVAVEPFIEINKDFSFTVTATDPDGAVITDFNQMLAWRSNLMSVPPDWLAPDDGLLVGCTPGSWTSGVLTYTGCRVTAEDHTQDRWIGVGYFDIDLNKPITGYDTLRAVNVETAPLDHFVVFTMTKSVLINTDFTIQVEARISPDLGNFIKTNYNNIAEVLADGSDMNQDDDGVITPTTIGDPANTGTWTNGMVNFDYYQISVADQYIITVRDLSVPASGSTDITVQAPAPFIAMLNPNSGPVGQEVIITGTNFGATAGEVWFGAELAALKTGTTWTDTELTVIAPNQPDGIPGSSMPVPVRVVTAAGAGSNIVIYTYIFGSGNQPQVTSIVPNQGPIAGGTAVTISGNNFVPGPTPISTIVKFGTVAATDVMVLNNQTITATTPAHTAGAVNVEVINPDGLNGVLTNGFTYFNPADIPNITNLSPDHGSPAGGTLVTITGTNLGATLGTVHFGQTATVIFWSDTLIRVISPSGIAGVGVQVSVTHANGESSNWLPYTYGDSASTTVRYYSPNFLVTELKSLDSIAILAEDYPTDSNTSTVTVALGLFDATGTAVFAGDDAGYFVMTGVNQYDLDKLISISADPAFANARMIRFRIDMYTSDSGLTTNQPWVESVSLNYTLVNGVIGVITFANTETAPYEKELPNDTNTPISYDLVATSNLTSGDPTFSNMVIGIGWVDQPPVGLHAWVEVIPGYVNNTITEFGPGTTVQFKVFFLTGVGVNLLDGSYRFQITGRLASNPAITLTPSPEGAILTGPVAVPSFTLNVVPTDKQKVVAQGDAVSFTVEVTGAGGFGGDVTLSTNVETQFSTGRITSPTFVPLAVTIPAGSTTPVPATLSFQTTISGLPTDLEKWVSFSVDGISGTLQDSDTAELFILSQPVPDGEFVLVATDADKTTQPSTDVVYGIEVVYHPNFPINNTIALSAPDLATQFTGVTGQFNPPTLTGGVTSAQLTLTVGANPTPLDTATSFIIRGTADTVSVIVVDAAPTPTLTINSIISDGVTLNLIMPVSDLLMAAPEICDGTNVDVCDDWLDGFSTYLYPSDATNQDDTRAIRLSNAPNIVVTPDVNNVYPAGSTNRAQLNGVVTITKASLTDAMEYIIYARSGRHVWTRADLTWTYDAGAVSQDVNVAFTTVFEVGDVDALHNNRVNVGDVITTANAASTAFNSLFDFDNNNRVNIGDVIQAANQSPKQGDSFFD